MTYRSRHWPSTHGIVVDAVYKFHYNYAYLGSNKRPKFLEVLLFLTFEYEVDNAAYCSDLDSAGSVIYKSRFTPLDQAPTTRKLNLFHRLTKGKLINHTLPLKYLPPGDRQLLEIEEKRYLGDKVTVYYHPRKPHIGCLSNQVSMGEWLAVVGNYVATAICFGLAYVAIDIGFFS